MAIRVRAVLLPIAAAAIGLGLFGAGRFMRQASGISARVTVRPNRLIADGYDTAEIEVDSDKPPRLVLDNPHAAAASSFTATAGHWHATIRAGVLPARVRLRIDVEDAPPAFADLVFAADPRDRYGDGTPDCLRLDSVRDRELFRRWFTYLAEAQYFQPPAARPAEIDDCAALIRYAYREALRAHESGWAEAARVPVAPAFESVAKYHYPYTLLGAALFRVREGGFRGADLSDGTFAQFADAATLCRWNTHRAGRQLTRALPGDLLFFRQPGEPPTFHSMIYLGASQLRPDGARYVVYHTGPDAEGPGEIRRLKVEELMRFPRPEWRPAAENPAFLGIFRWNILREETDADAPPHS